MALGAESTDVLRLVMSKGLVLVGMGTTIGIVLGLAVEHLMNSMLFNSGSVDILAYVIVVPSLFAITTLAAYLPARKASMPFACISAIAPFGAGTPHCQ